MDRKAGLVPVEHPAAIEFRDRHVEHGVLREQEPERVGRTGVEQRQNGCAADEPDRQPLDGLEPRQPPVLPQQGQDW
jgi:hypothetical protein